MVKKIIKSDTVINDFACDNSSEEIISFSSGTIDENAITVKMFSFDNDDNKDDLINLNPNSSIESKSNLNLEKPQNINTPNTVSKIRGITPGVANESFSVKRCYQFRPSTLKKLNQLKGESDDFDIYLNEIIDQAICYYHDLIFNQNK